MRPDGDAPIRVSLAKTGCKDRAQGVGYGRAGGAAACWGKPARHHVRGRRGAVGAEGPAQAGGGPPPPPAAAAGGPLFPLRRGAPGAPGRPPPPVVFRLARPLPPPPPPPLAP